MDTAETLGKGKFAVSNNITFGIDMEEWSVEEPYEDYPREYIHPMMYLEFKYGLTDDVDVSMRGGSIGDPSSAKLLIKKQLQGNDKNSTAIVFGGGLLKGKPSQWEDAIRDVKEWQVYTANLALLHTFKFSRRFHMTMATIGSYHDFSTKLHNNTIIQDDVYHAGLRANWKLSGSSLFGILELGVEQQFMTQNDIEPQPWIGIGAGVEFKK